MSIILAAVRSATAIGATRPIVCPQIVCVRIWSFVGGYCSCNALGSPIRQTSGEPSCLRALIAVSYLAVGVSVLAIGAAHTADASVHDFLAFIDELVQAILFPLDPQMELC
ncbi:hypothetical protein PXK20_17210 [Phaeobacter gallaeciensis]|nr:hypothetical protein [Phaeobacter gallaeciensis]